MASVEPVWIHVAPGVKVREDVYAELHRHQVVDAGAGVAVAVGVVTRYKHTKTRAERRALKKVRRLRKKEGDK